MMNRRVAMIARQRCVTECRLAKAARRLSAVARPLAAVASYLSVLAR